MFGKSALGLTTSNHLRLSHSASATTGLSYVTMIHIRIWCQVIGQPGFCFGKTGKVEVVRTEDSTSVPKENEGTIKSSRIESQGGLCNIGDEN